MVASRSRWTGLFIGSVVPCFAGPGQGRGRVRDRPTAVSPGSSVPDGFAAYVNTGIGQAGQRSKNIGCHVQIAENLLQRPASARPDIQGFVCRTTGICHQKWRADLPARSRSGLAQQQATRRFLASIDRVRGAAIQARYCLALVGGDRFHQGHQLTLYGLVLDLAVGTQQPQAERLSRKSRLSTSRALPSPS